MREEREELINAYHASIKLRCTSQKFGEHKSIWRDIGVVQGTDKCN